MKTPLLPKTENASLAFTLNVTFSVIKKCSALAFTLDGLVKDAFIVMCGTALLGETVVYQQHMAFFVCLTKSEACTFDNLVARRRKTECFSVKKF